MNHVPVLLEEALHALNPRDGGLYVDATFGAGGYSRAILGAAEARVIAIDRDPRARKAADVLRAAHPGRFIFVQACFGELEGVLEQSGAEQVDGMVFDLGVFLVVIASILLALSELGRLSRNEIDGKEH